MHHVGIALDHHLLGQLHRTDFRNAPGVVTPEVDQHQVLGNFLVVAEQVLFQRQISLFGRATRASAGDRAHGNQIVFDAHQHFRRTAHHVEVTEVEEIHVRRRVEATQRAIQIDRRSLEVDGHALRRHHLHAVTGQDVFLDRVDRALVVILSKA